MRNGRRMTTESRGEAQHTKTNVQVTLIKKLSTYIIQCPARVLLLAAALNSEVLARLE